MQEAVLQALILLLGMGLFTVVAYGDVRARRIPNALVLGVAALGLFRLIVAADAITAVYTLTAAAAVFAAAFLLFWRGYLGGGDVKLMAATALLVGYHDLCGFLLVMSVCGALVALAVFTADKLGWGPLPNSAELSPAQQEDREKLARVTVPYGVAIAAAGVLILFLQSSPPG
jgi:prepilin peptidase CpaA